jgi:hypothetical protein
MIINYYCNYNNLKLKKNINAVNDDYNHNAIAKISKIYHGLHLRTPI